MSRIKLDRIDRKILHDLQDDGRITNVDLAKNAGISAPPCLRRVRALEEAGYIRGYHAEIDSGLMGFGVTVFAFVSLKSQSEQGLREFSDWADGCDYIRECHMLSGETDYLLKIVARDWDDYQQFLMSKLTSAPNVDKVKSALSIRTSKQKPGVPIDV